MTILIVEDCPDTRARLASQFFRLGFKILEAADGSQGLKSLDAPKLVGVLADIDMPAMGGIEFLINVRNKAPDLPVFIISSSSEMQEREVVLLGATAYYDKNNINVQEIADYVTLNHKLQNVIQFN